MNYEDHTRTIILPFAPPEGLRSTRRVLIFGKYIAIVIYLDWYS